MARTARNSSRLSFYLPDPRRESHVQLRHAVCKPTSMGRCSLRVECLTERIYPSLSTDGVMIGSGNDVDDLYLTEKTKPGTVRSVLISLRLRSNTAAAIDHGRRQLPHSSHRRRRYQSENRILISLCSSKTDVSELHSRTSKRKPDRTFFRSTRSSDLPLNRSRPF